MEPKGDAGRHGISQSNGGYGKDYSFHSGHRKSDSDVRATIRCEDKPWSFHSDDVYSVVADFRTRTVKIEEASSALCQKVYNI